VDVGFTIAVLAAVAFAVTNGLHDASNAIATLIATRAATPAQGIALATVCNLLGPLLVGGAVANTIGGIVTLDASATVAVIGWGVAAACAWNILTWKLGLPSSSGHALIGGLVGAGLIAGGADAVNWGGFDGWRPTGVVGTLVALAVSPAVGLLAAYALVRALRRAARRATRRWLPPVRAAEWVMSGALAFSHGANDAQKSVGVIGALMLADGRAGSLSAPTWSKVLCAAALTLGTALGGWKIIRTVGRRIYRIKPLDGLSSQSASAGVILGASLLGAPISTTHTVASSVIGTGLGEHRRRHVHWAIVGQMGLAWATTIPATAAMAAATYELWRVIS
jgi:PiT family inorganic phosphate transporter